MSEFSLILVLQKENKQNSNMTWQKYKLNLRNSHLLEEFFQSWRNLTPCFQPFRHDAFRKGFARPALEEPHFRLIQTVVFRQLLHQWFGQQGIGRMATAFFSFWAALIKIYSYFRLYTFMSIYVKNSC